MLLDQSFALQVKAPTLFTLQRKPAPFPFVMASMNMQRRMVSPILSRVCPSLSATDRQQLSKEDESAVNEVEVRREDQDKINKFSRLHQRELILEEELKGKNVRSTTLSTSKSG